MTQKKKFKITPEDRENLYEFKVNRAVSDTVMKVLEGYIELMKNDVMNFDLNKGSFANLGIYKSRVDGAAYLLNKLRMEINRVAASNAGGKDE